MFYGVLILSVICIGYLLSKLILPMLAKARAYRELQPMLFSREEKRNVISKLHEITANRFSDEEVLDYYLKIKGSQISKHNNNRSFWVKRYLVAPANIKLNYFEQVRFYEIFMGYVGNNEPKISNYLKTIFDNYKEASSHIMLKEEMA